MPGIQLITPGDLQGSGEAGPFPIEQFALRFLAQGDSWFSIGAIPPLGTTNLLDKLTLSKRAVAVNCARPGAELVHMVDSTTSTTFLQLLSGTIARPWTALLLSGLGNDVISASQSPPGETPDRRLLNRPEERGSSGPVARYISEPGWATFSTHARAVFDQLLANRDKTPINRGLPIVLHTYDFATPRNSAAGPGFGPWLFKAMRSYAVPEADWQAVGRELIGRVATLIKSIAAAEPSVHVVDTLGTLQPAATTDAGATLHWRNEIHPTKAGYRLLDKRWEPVLEGLFGGG